MIKKFIKGKVCVFVDAANIFYTQKTLGWKISYERLKEYFQDECLDGLGKMFVYTAYDKDRPQQKKFLNMLEVNGYILRTKEVKRIRVAKGVYEWKVILAWNYQWMF